MKLHPAIGTHIPVRDDLSDKHINRDVLSASTAFRARERARLFRERERERYRLRYRFLIIHFTGTIFALHQNLQSLNFTHMMKLSHT